MMRRRIWLGILVWGLLSALAAAGQPQRLGQPDFPWPSSQGLAQANSLDVGRIGAFVRSLFPDDGSTFDIGEFRFAALEPGRTHLVVTADFSGRAFYYTLLLVWPAGDGTFRYTSLSSAGPHVLGREIVDLDGDGFSELLVKELAGGYEGADTVPLYWISVKKMIGGELQDQSAQFADFYRNEYVPMLNALDRAASCAEGGSEASCKTAALTQFLRFRMEREAFSRPKAGLEKALAWSESSQGHLQVLAVRTLAEIDDPRADSALERLANSSNQTVASRAQEALQAKRSQS